MGNAASTVPYGAQISQVFAALTMLVSVDESVHVFPTKLSLTAPLVGGSGQQVYFSDIVGSTQVPDFYKDQASSLGSDHYNASIQLVLGLSGASPSTYSIYQNVTKQWNDSDATLLNFPQAGGVLDPVGPFVLGEAGQNADLTITSLSVTVQYLNSTGDVVSYYGRPTYAFYVPGVQGFLYVASSTFVDNSSGPPLQPSNGFPGRFPAIDQDEKTTFVNVPINCSQQNSLGRSTKTDFNLTTGGTGPAVVKTGDTFSFKNFNNYFTLAADFVGTLSAIYGSNGQRTEGLRVNLGYVTSGQDLGTGLGLTLSNASPDSVDVARQFTSTNSDEGNPLSTAFYIPSQDDKPETAALPRTGALTLGPFTAGANGSQIGADFTTLNAFASVEDAYFGLSGQGTVACQAVSPIAFLSAPIIAA